MKQGWFYDGHRALSDALAGVFLLSFILPASRQPALSALLEKARKPLKAIRAENAPFEARELLKTRGYKWDPGDDKSGRVKSWWVLVEDSDAECIWLRQHVLPKAKSFVVRDVSAKKRFSGRIWD